MGRKKIIWIGGILLLLFVFIAGGGYYYFVRKPNVIVQDDGIVYIHNGDSFEQVLEMLQSKGYIQNTYTLRKVAELKKYPDNVKAGRYRLENQMSNNRLINKLRAGDQDAVHFTFNNIRTLPELAAVISRQLDIDSLDFLKLTGNPDFIKEFGFTPDNFAGIFLPNTYQIYWNTTAEGFVRRIYSEYKKFWNQERLTKAQKTGLSPIEVIILASIVEEETNRTEEYPVIAGVYINRLNKNWKLEACPTLKFALGDFSIKRVLDKHLKIDSPYNTYKYIGLPPGPVRMPSVKAIDAVLNYQRHDYMFFCAKSDFSGTHYFSRTLRQHNRHAAEYHRALNQKKIY